MGALLGALAEARSGRSRERGREGEREKKEVVWELKVTPAMAQSPKLYFDHSFMLYCIVYDNKLMIIG
jgi:hypothetical protein